MSKRVPLPVTLEAKREQTLRLVHSGEHLCIRVDDANARGDSDLVANLNEQLYHKLIKIRAIWRESEGL